MNTLRQINHFQATTRHRPNQHVPVI